MKMLVIKLKVKVVNCRTNPFCHAARLLFLCIVQQNGKFFPSVPAGKVLFPKACFYQGCNLYKDIVAAFVTICVVEFLEMIDVNVLDGKLFSNAEAELESTIMLNQEAVSFFGWENPVGHRHYSEFWGKYQVTAVVQDFHYQDATKEVGPLVLMNSKRYSLIVCLQYDPNQIAPVLSHFENTWQKFSPEFPLEYHFLEDNFKNYYHDLRMQGRVFLYFSLLAFFIASLGLYGMVAHLAVKRRKAICIRKIHGASGQQLYYLLSSEILILITIAFITSVPLSYLFVSQWLEQFPYHINIQWHIFVFSGLLAILVALITISSHLIRLMRINPAEALRYE